MGYTNQDVNPIPDLSQSGTEPGPLNPNPSLVTPYPAPDTNAVGAGGGPVITR